ncbi:MAG: extracellular solute-binding protein [Meiothermus sp.]|nr:extracellular solute-binding protein [Meiothermus sp.]
MKKSWMTIGVVAVGLVALAQTLNALVDGAKREGQIVSYGSPADWAGYGAISEIMTKRYGLKHSDTDMSSAEEIAKWDAEKNNPVADVGDIGLQFGPIAEDRGVLLAYKHSKWNEIPAWAKDANGLYSATYYGTIVFATNTKIVKNPPKTWKDLLKPEYKGLVGLSDPRRAALGQYAVIAASFAGGGSENNIAPGIKFFADLQKAGNLKPVQPSKDLLAKGEIGVNIMWDFQAFPWKKDLPELNIQVPQDGSTFGPYATVINKYTRRPNAAKLWIETVLSDEGQIAFAKAGARPIRKVKLPKDVEDGLLPEAQYDAAKPITNWRNMENISKGIGEKWATDVLGQ